MANRTINLHNFRGLNTRDSLETLDPIESPSNQNMRLTTRGGIVARPGCLNVATLPGTSNTTVDIFHSEALNLWLCARTSAGTYRLFTRPGDLSGVWTDRGQISSSISARATFADWPGTTPYCLIATDISDATNGGVYTLDATPTLTKRAAGASRAITVWQNKVWVLEAAASQTTLSASAVGDPTSGFPLTVQLREKDASPLTAIGVAGGALIVFKKNSVYRITDVSTGAYATIDTGSGCVNPRALVGLRGRLYTWGTDALYECDGVGPLNPVSDKVRPTILAHASDGTRICAGVVEDRVLFAHPLAAGGSEANALLEYDPEQGAFMRHALASSSQDDVTSFASKDKTLYAAIKDGDDLFKVFSETPGADDGSNVTSLYKTAPVNLGGLARLQRARAYGSAQVNGTNTKEMRVYKNWDPAVPAETYDITTGFETLDSQEVADLQALGHAEAFQLEFRVTGGTGAAQLDRLLLDLTPLSR